MKKILGISVVCVFIDQIIKNIISASLNTGEGISIIKNFFSITYLENTGAAFSIFSNGTIFLIMVSIIALILIYFFFIKDKQLKTLEKCTYGLLIGGILGNLLDRIFKGYVIDYLDFNIFGYNFPVFNLADILIVISIALLIIIIYKGDKNEV